MQKAKDSEFGMERRELERSTKGKVSRDEETEAERPKQYCLCLSLIHDAHKCRFELQKQDFALCFWILKTR